MTGSSRWERVLSEGNCIHPASVFVRLGTTCNQNCDFCNIRGQGDFELDQEQSLRFLRHATRSRSRPVIHFTGGEPTMRRDLLELVAAARALGAADVILQTNGLRLAHYSYAKALQAAGLGGLILSLHGSDPQIHESLTKTPGSFHLACKSLTTALDLGMDVWVNTVFVKANLAEGPGLVQLIHERFPAVKGLILSTVQPHGQARASGINIVPSFDQSASAVRETIAACESCLLPYHFAICENPLCFSIRVLGTFGLPNQLLQTISVASHQKHCRGCTLRSAMLKDKIKVSGCQMCALSSACDGVWEEQIAFYGESELAPLPTVPDATAEAS